MQQLWGEKMTKLLVKLFIKNSENTSDPEIRQKYGYLSGFVGIVMNLILFTGKIIAGLITTSISIVADAFNNLSDAGSSIITLVGFKMAGRPADREHPYGHGRIEYVSGFIVSIVIMLMGFELGKSSFEKIFSPEEITFNWLSFGILIGSILIKLWLCFFNRKLGGMINSAPMKAAAMDSLSDVAATSAVIIGLLVFLIFGISIDGYVGIVVALFILYTGVNTAKESLNPLLGQYPDKEFVDEIEKTVMSYNGVIGVHDLLVHDYGIGARIISLHAEVPCSMDFVAAHELIDVIEDDLRVKYKCHATIHMDPVAADDKPTIEMKARVVDIVKKIDPELTIHDFRMTNGVNHRNLIFDVVVPFNFRLSDDDVVRLIRASVAEFDDSLSAVINVDKKMS